MKAPPDSDGRRVGGGRRSITATRRIWLLGGLAVPLVSLLLVGSGLAVSYPKIAPSHGRPYFMPPGERARILDLIRREPWARAELERLRSAAKGGDGYASALLYALEGSARYLLAARKWLLEYGRQGGDIGKRALEAGPEFFKGGQPGLPEVYYGIDVVPLIAYDWVYTGLSPDDRQIVEGGILASARFRMRAMDRWSQTANLVFTPTYMVATAGLVTGQKELVDWGFYRKPGSHRGGYFSVLDVMLRDGGPWGEAPIYPLHNSLLLMTRMSRHLQLLTREDWFSRSTPSGSGSPKGLVDYYVDTAYPIERTGRGAGQIRVATYGDGATNADGDFFLVNPAGPGFDLHEQLAEAYAASGDPRYAAFLAMIADYRPNLVNRRPLPPSPRFPPAPSRVWPTHGLAMLRSDESPDYWTSGRAIAVSQIMSQGYGHDHRDKFSITLHGAGRLLYPDYNAIQYENPAIGWTRNSVAHNTLMVDEQDTRDAKPTGIRSDFTAGVKFLATSASGVFEGVDQTRVLLLTGDYLLDLFHAGSAVPHTYDYLLHSFGRPRPGEPGRFTATSALLKRYWLMARPQGATLDDQWSLDFVLDGATAREKEAADRRWLEETLKRKPRPALYGKEWYEHTAAVRVTMAADPGTLVAYGVGMQDVPMLVARRTGRRETVFVATHEPVAGGEGPRVSRITILARSRDAAVVRVDARDFTDYAAAAFGPQGGRPEHVLVSAADAGLRFAFKSHGYLRVAPDGSMTAWGGWTGFTIPGRGGALMLNGQRATGSQAGGYASFGKSSGRPAPPVVTEPENPFPVKLSPAVARVASRGRRIMTLALTNVLSDPAWGWLEFEPPIGLAIDPKRPAFGPLQPGATAPLTVTVVADNPAAGRHALRYRVHYAVSSARIPIATGALAFPVAVEPVLTPVYRHPDSAAYRLDAPTFTALLDMFQGLCRYLADDDDTVRLDGSPLFTFSDGEKALLSDNTTHAFTWPTESPAHLTAHTYDRARYNLSFVGDRIIVQMDPDWTQAPRTHFAIPGQWRSAEGPPRWGQLVTAEKKLAAAELAFPRARWNLCFEFLPPQEVTVEGTGLRFTVDSLARAQWTVGFCKPGTLSQWRWRSR